MKTFMLATLATVALAFDGSGDISSEADLDAYLANLGNGGSKFNDGASKENLEQKAKSECVGGYIKDLALYADCKVIKGFLAIMDSDIANLDALVHPERIEAVANNMPAPAQPPEHRRHPQPQHRRQHSAPTATRWSTLRRPGGGAAGRRRRPCPLRAARAARRSTRVTART